MLGGGLGWWVLVGEIAADPGGAWALLGNLPHDYSITSPDPGVLPYRWGNVVTTLLIPQRGFQLAMPVAVAVFRQWWLATGAHAPATVEDEGRARRRMVGAGAAAGLLPLMHGHTYLVVIGLAVCLLVTLPPRRRWLEFLAVALLLGGPQVVWLAWGSAVHGQSFLGWEVGWDRRGTNPVLFWMANAGLFIPAAGAAVLWRGSRPLLSDRLLRYYLPFTLCFVGANLVRLAPWIWDNVKVLVYGFVATAPIVALLLATLWRRGRWWRLLVAVSMLVLTLSGVLDLWRVAVGSAQVDVFDRASVEFAEAVKDATASDRRHPPCADLQPSRLPHRAPVTDGLSWPLVDARACPTPSARPTSVGCTPRRTGPPTCWRGIRSATSSSDPSSGASARPRTRPSPAIPW